MTPKIIFRYSGIYDRNWNEWIKLYPRRTKKPYPKREQILRYMKKIEPIWRKQEKEVLNELSRVTKLSWRVKEITCYIVGRCRPFSDPLTIMTYKSTNDFIDTLTHELIHQLFTQKGNLARYIKGWERIDRKYKKESRITRIHIPLHAIHEHILRKLFGLKRLKREIETTLTKDYQRAWEIVQNEGYKNIIGMMIK